MSTENDFPIRALTPDEQREAADLLERALVWAPMRRQDDEAAKPRLGDEIIEFLFRIRAQEDQDG